MNIESGSGGSWYQLYLDDGKNLKLNDEFKAIPSSIFNASNERLIGHHRSGGTNGTYYIYNWEGENLYINKVIEYSTYIPGANPEIGTDEKRCILEGKFDTLEMAEEAFDDEKKCTQKVMGEFDKQDEFGQKEINNYQAFLDSI